MGFKNIGFLLVLLIFTSLSGQERQLVWEDNFDGNKLQSDNWNIVTGDGCPNLCGWGNNERQIYSADNHTVANGFLTITAKKEGQAYTSTRINSKGKKEFQYGKIEIRAKLALGKGVWPAFWMLGSNIDVVGWPRAGEIDILEYVGKEPDHIFTSLHTPASYGTTINTKKAIVPGIEEGFHTYAIDWTKDRIRFLIDDQLFYEFAPENKNQDTWPFDQPFYILVNLAVGGNFGGPEVDDSIFPQEYVVDYIRVFQ